MDLYGLGTLVITAVSVLGSISYWGGRLGSKLDTLIAHVKTQEGKIDKLQDSVSKHEAWIQDLRSK